MFRKSLFISLLNLKKWCFILFGGTAIQSKVVYFQSVLYPTGFNNLFKGAVGIIWIDSERK